MWVEDKVRTNLENLEKCLFLAIVIQGCEKALKQKIKAENLEKVVFSCCEVKGFGRSVTTKSLPGSIRTSLFVTATGLRDRSSRIS